MKSILTVLFWTITLHVSVAQNWVSVGGGADGVVRGCYSDTINNRLYVVGNFRK